MTQPRVMFVRTGGIGNALAAVPALRALRRAWPEAFVAAIVDPASAGALRGCPYVDEFIVYDKRGKDSGSLGWLKILMELRKRKFTYAILSKRFLRMSLLARLSGASIRVGFWGYGHAITHPVKWDANRSVVLTNLDLLAALGIAPSGNEIEVWPSDEDKKHVDEFLEKNNLKNQKQIVAIHPGGISNRESLWPAENYAELAGMIEEAYNAVPLFIGGPADAEILSIIKGVAPDRFPICDKLTILGTAHLLSKCRFFVGSDSAPSHLANAAATPAVVYWGPKKDSDESFARWSPPTGLTIAAKPLPDGRHPNVRDMMQYVAELIEKMNARGTRPK